jgi:hypothetical protein
VCDSDPSTPFSAKVKNKWSSAFKVCTEGISRFTAAAAITQGITGAQILKLEN